jgi:hypothetical protein
MHAHTHALPHSRPRPQNVLYEPAGGSFFVYFTNWTFCLFGLTGLLGTSLTAKAISAAECAL